MCPRLISHVQRGPATARARVDPGTLGEQDHYNANMPFTSGRVQRGPAIAPLRIDRNTGRKQNLNSTDLSCLGCRMQQHLAISPPWRVGH